MPTPTTDALSQIPSELPVLPLRRSVLFPLTLQPLAVDRPVSIESINRALAGDRMLFLTMQRTEADDPQPSDLHRIGTVGVIRQMAKAPNGVHVIVEGLARAAGEPIVRDELRFSATLTADAEDREQSIEVDAYVRRLRELMDRAMTLASGLSQELRGIVMGIDDPLRLAYLLASLLDMKAEDKQRLLEEDRLLVKLQAVAGTLNREIALLELKGKIESQAQQEMTDAQRQYYLRQQLKAIQEELGEKEGAEVDELRERVEQAGLPEHAATVARRELDRLERMGPASPEYQMIRTYLDWVLDVPWAKTTDDRLDPVEARRVLDEDHYDLDKVKERIVEYLAVRKLMGDMKGPILCFVGAPGVGKTSLGQSIARAMNRKFIRISLGGVRDEAEIRGHRRTYIGALPGRIIQALKQAGSANPVFMLDEVDKMSVGFQGDPAAALLEVLDPAQNNSFRDHYLEINYDLSRVLFIATANQLGPVHPALLDRMEVISLAGYTEEEKLQIARQYLIPRQLLEHGLPPDGVELPDETLRGVIGQYTREAGVRNLERQIGTIARKVAARVATNPEGTAEIAATRVERDRLPEYLGPPRIHGEVAFRTSRPGVATGVAWTETGGDVLFVEATLLPGGKGGLTLTGQLGNVMQESAKAAVSHIRANAHALGIDPEV
ncbi:MAG TPA: endopeptidase La, partial [Vicinamibacterales bacterium]|nr:endopeptidase La [Vicinamibacterales bacterium]